MRLIVKVQGRIIVVRPCCTIVQCEHLSLHELYFIISALCTQYLGFQTDSRGCLQTNAGQISDRFVHWLEKRGAIVVIPSRKTARHPRDIDRHIYMERHLVENLFLKFKARRRFATRYEKRACLFFAVTRLAAILVWIA